MDLSSFLRRAFKSRALRHAVVLFLVARLLLSAWALVVQTVIPVPAVPDEVLRPYLGAPVLSAGPNDSLANYLLGPWQRFDTMRYLALARDGYDAPNSVFPPLYPLAIRTLGALFAVLSGAPVDTANLVAAIVLGNLALIGALALFHRLIAAELSPADPPRTLLYLLFFPTGFFLLAAYTESLFLFFALGAFLAMKHERPLLAGSFGALAALTRLTGWGLVIPLAYLYLQQRGWSWRRIDWRGIGVLLPGLALLAFLLWRAAAGFPSLAEVYQSQWLQSTRLPGRDLFVALRSLITGSGPRAGEFTLLFDFLCLLLLLATTPAAFRLGRAYGLYNLVMLLFMLLPASDFKPLYSFSRYTLVFFPTFMVLGRLGRRPWLNRLILYPSLALYLYFSGQFFLWGWVA
ncbi:MAG: mannosyltransferase family protein [Anaerolineae bacterium]|nr:mannosyltransferase family protein [Anaerolineae bacterium]